MSDHDNPGTDLADRDLADSPRAGSVALTGARSETLQRPRRASSPQDETTARSKPLILPPARLDQELAAEAARVRREVVGARQEHPRVDEPRTESAQDRSIDDEPVEGGPVEGGPVEGGPIESEPVEDAQAAHQPAPEPPPLAGLPTTGVPASQAEELAAALREHPGLAAAFRAAAASAWPEDEAHAGADGADVDDRFDATRHDQLEDPLENPLADMIPPSGTPFIPQQPVAARPSSALARTSHALRPTGGDEPHDDSVAAVAAAVIASMRAVGEAHERHLESIELESGRRSELLTAQAELDAELIRLHARREAHAIIAAARMRTGEQRSPVEADQLREIGETFSRFAETIESNIISGPASTRGPRDL